MNWDLAGPLESCGNDFTGLSVVDLLRENSMKLPKGPMKTVGLSTGDCRFRVGGLDLGCRYTLGLEVWMCNIQPILQPKPRFEKDASLKGRPSRNLGRIYKAFYVYIYIYVYIQRYSYFGASICMECGRILEVPKGIPYWISLGFRVLGF